MYRKTVIFLSICLISFFLTFLYRCCLGNYLPYLKQIEEISTEYELEKSLVLAICQVESGFQEKAKSNKGALGIMQVMPKTAKYVCEINDIDYRDIDLNSASDNIKIGCLYLKYLKNTFAGEWLLVAYNAGEGIAKSWMEKDVIEYKETKDYVKKVNFFKSLYSLL